ncbi:MAG TPA: LLM class flavin-dependent oxidoreductase [Candidatus Binatia bacterium]|nr:LLM class flavin-dependent oxidoreductase [Candidatus Binatia bacterium]
MARRICITLDWQNLTDRDKLFRQVQIADEVGVDTVWVAEAWGRDAFSLLALLADRTRRIQLGTGIVNVYSRTPAALAQHFATLDELSGGRAVAGFGTSGPQVIEHFHGVPFKPTLARLRETIEIFNTLISGTPLRHRGRLFQLERGFTLRFETVRKHIPVWLASLNPNALRLTAELCDGWMPIMIPEPVLAREIAAFRKLVTDAGRPANAVQVRSPDRVVVALEDPKRARRQAAGTLAFYIARMGTFYGAQLERFGHGDAVAAVRKAWSERGSEAGIDAVPDELVDQVTTVGTISECTARLDAESKAGVDMHNVSVQTRSEAELERALGELVGS